MSSLPIIIASSIAAKAGSNGARYSKFGDITVAPLCISHCYTNNNNHSSKDSNSLSVRVGDLKKTFPPAIMRLLQLQLPRYNSDSLKLSLTPSIVTFILQSGDGDNWAGDTGDEYTPYQTGDQADSRSNLIELGPVTLVQRRLSWQSVALYRSALNELARETRANQWTIGLATELDSTVHLILFICRAWRVPVDRLMHVLLHPKANPSPQPIKRKRFACASFDAPSSVTNRADFEYSSSITTTTTSTNKNNKLIIVHPSASSKSAPQSLCTLNKSCSWSTKLCCPVPSPSRTVWTKRPILFSLFYIYCVLLLCTGAYHIDTQSAYDQKQTIQSDRSQPDWFPNPPDKAQLRARTPNYLFRLHDRHMRNWLDFDQFEADRLRHPIHRRRLGDLNWEKLDEARLGAITAVRHHRHMGTFQDHAIVNDPFIQPLLVHHSPESELRGHRLMFRLAEMPENEQLIAASLRLRYVPSTVRNSSSTADRIRSHCGNAKIDSHYWPITLWLHYDSTNQSHPWDLETVGSFEPDEPICEWSIMGLHNHTVLHLPPGWFHIPLSSTILSLLQQVNMYSDPSKYVTIRLRSLSPSANKDTTLNELRLHPRSEDAVEMAQWVHEAPHLFTFHRDPDVLIPSKRTRRSIPDPNIGSGDQVQLDPTITKPVPSEQFHRKPITTAHMDLRARARRGATFEKRYRRLQRMLHSGLRTAEQKNRPRRRAAMPRRNNRASSDEWRQQSMTRDAYYYGSAGSQSLEPGNTYSQSTKDGFQGHGLPGGNTNTYGSTRTESSGDEFHNMDSISADDYLESTCQRRDLVIDFDAVGWAGWVIAPQAYNARYCRGQCPFPLSTHYNTTNHAVLLQLVHLLDAARISGPCCVPNQLSSQSLLYHKQNGDVVLRVYQDMVVESCACR